MTDHDARRREDWCWVPVEPTEAMIQAACDATFGRDPLTPESAHRKGYAAMLAATPTPEAVEGLEPPGCPTPGACSCPDGEAELAKRLATSETAHAETRARCEAAEKEADYLRMGWDGLCAKLDAAQARIAALEAETDRLEHMLKVKVRLAENTNKYWLRASKAALEGKPQELRNRVALAEAPFVAVELSTAALDPKAETGR